MDQKTFKEAEALNKNTFLARDIKAAITEYLTSKSTRFLGGLVQFSMSQLPKEDLKDLAKFFENIAIKYENKLKEL